MVSFRCVYHNFFKNPEGNLGELTSDKMLRLVKVVVGLSLRVEQRSVPKSLMNGGV